MKTVHKRQDSALSKYENSNAELPQLLSSHAEEVRMWTTRCRELQQKNKELQMNLKQKEALIMSITDENKHLSKLNKDRNLLERAQLQSRVKMLEERSMEKEAEIKAIIRRFETEQKSYKTNIHMEQMKYRELIMQIDLSDLMSNTNIKKNLSPRASLHNPIRNKSPPMRVSSKSASNLTQPNGMREVNLSSKTTLPLVSDNTNNSNTNNSETTMKKIEESAKQNSPSVNNNVKKMPDINDNNKTNFNNNNHEVDLTKNCIDTSDRIKSPPLNGNKNLKSPTSPRKYGSSVEKSENLKSPRRIGKSVEKTEQMKSPRRIGKSNTVVKSDKVQSPTSPIKYTNCKHSDQEEIYENDDEDDNKTILAQNGTSRARPQNTKTKTNTHKTTPLHKQQKPINSNKNDKSEKKSASDDSEFSDDDDDLTFVGDHNNGTRMVIISPIAVSELENIVGVYVSPFSWMFA